MPGDDTSNSTLGTTLQSSYSFTVSFSHLSVALGRHGLARMRHGLGEQRMDATHKDRLEWDVACLIVCLRIDRVIVD